MNTIREAARSLWYRMTDDDCNFRRYSPDEFADAVAAAIEPCVSGMRADLELARRGLAEARELVEIGSEVNAQVCRERDAARAASVVKGALDYERSPAEQEMFAVECAKADEEIKAASAGVTHDRPDHDGLKRGKAVNQKEEAALGAALLEWRSLSHRRHKSDPHKAVMQHLSHLVILREPLGTSDVRAQPMPPRDANEEASNDK